MSVFIGVEKLDGTTVHEARDYQTKAFKTFMVATAAVAGAASIMLHFKEGGYHIQVYTMSDIFPGLSGDYPRFCVLVNDKGEKHILSDDRALLTGFTGWKNRVSGAGMAGYKKKSTKRKSTKRKKSTKKK